MSVIDLQGTNWVYYSKIKRFSGVIALKIGCVVLAAGNARRFGSNKLKAQVDGESLIRRALEAVPSGLVTVVVSQYPDILALAGEYGFAAVANDLGHDGVRGNPCLFPARFYPELLELTGDRGGSAVIRRHEEDLLLLETDALELTDVDTPDALEQVKNVESSEQ